MRRRREELDDEREDQVVHEARQDGMGGRHRVEAAQRRRSPGTSEVPCRANREQNVCRKVWSGAPAAAIQQLAGHSTYSTTARYVHLFEGAKESAIRLLEGPKFGDILETGVSEPAQ